MGVVAERVKRHEKLGGMIGFLQLSVKAGAGLLSVKPSIKLSR